MADQEKTTPAGPKAVTPFEFLQQFPGAPTAEQIESWKSQAPGRNLRLFHTPDGKRLYILRAIGGTELAQVQAQMPAGIKPENYVSEQQIAVAVRCCVWASDTTDHKMSDMAFRAGTAGLAQTLHEIIAELSDYCDPQTIQRCSADL